MKVPVFSFSEPSSVISPGKICPIIVSAQHFDTFAASTERLIIPALFGLVPRWHKGDFREHGFNTVNFRLENIVDSRMYKPAFNRGRRCVLMCEGFYEWQQAPLDRSIYFMHLSQPKGVKIEDNSTWTRDSPRLLHIAGIFDVWFDADRNSLHSFTMISTSSNETLEWLHPRTPAILETPEQIENWLNCTDISGMEALEFLTPPKNLEWFEVSPVCILNPGVNGIMCNQRLSWENCSYLK